MRNRDQLNYMWVSGAINIKDYYTETVITLAMTRAQIVSCSYHDV